MGKPLSEETKKKISEALTKNKADTIAQKSFIGGTEGEALLKDYRATKSE